MSQNKYFEIKKDKEINHKTTFIFAIKVDDPIQMNVVTLHTLAIPDIKLSQKYFKTLKLKDLCSRTGLKF